MKGTLWTIGFLVISPLLLSAVTLEELFEGARQTDLSTDLLQKDDRIRLKQYEIEDAKGGLVFSGFLNSTVGGSRALTGSVKLGIPFDQIPCLQKKDAIKEKTRDLEGFMSRWEYFKKEKEREQEILSLIKEILMKKREIIDWDMKITRKQKEWEGAFLFNTVQSETAGELTLKMELSRLNRERQEMQWEEEKTMRRLVSRTGLSASLPSLPPFSRPQLPEQDFRQRAPVLLAEEKRLLIREIEAGKTNAVNPARIIISGTAAFPAEDREGGISGGVSLEKKLGSMVDLSGGVNYGSDGISFSTQLGLSLSPTERKTKKLNMQLKKLNEERQRLIVEQTSLLSREKEQDFLSRIEKLRIGYENVLDDLIVGEQSVKELAYAQEKGFISERERQEGENSLKLLELDRKILILNALNLQSEIDQYYYIQKEETANE